MKYYIMVGTSLSNERSFIMNEIIQKMNRLTIDSREVARMVEKRHADLLRDLEMYSGYLSQNPKLDSVISGRNHRIN